MAVKIGIGSEAIVENDVAIIFRVAPGDRAATNHSQKHTKIRRCVSKALAWFHDIYASSFIGADDYDADYGAISACAGNPCAESGLIQTLTLAASAAN